jgi:hypothetical protein
MRANVSSRALEATIEDERNEMLAAMWRHYPAAARRIMKGLLQGLTRTPECKC